MPAVNRRSLLAGGSLLLGTGACSHPLAGMGAASQVPLPIPPLIDARQQGGAVSLRVQKGQTTVYRGDDVNMAVTNALAADTTVHSHGC